MNKATASLQDNRYEDQLIASLRSRKGRASLGDVVVDTGLPRSEVESHLRRLLSLYKSHLEVDEHGELLYLFDPSFSRRAEDGRYLYKLGVQLWGVFKFLFKVAIMVVLVVYFVLFLVLLIASLVSGRSSNSSSSRRFNPIGLIWYGGGSRSSRSSSFSSRDDADAQPFYKKVFAFVFGPEANIDDKDARADKKRLLEFIRANKGVISTADLVAHTGLGYAQAEEEMARILVEFDGDTHVTSEGVILYTFQQIAVSAADPAVSTPEPSWRRLITPTPLTGNTGGANALIGFLNAFNLVGSMFIPQLAAAELGFKLSPFLWFGLGVFPLLFSITFFAIPVGRWVLLRARNARVSLDNTRRLVIGEIFSQPRQAVQADALAQTLKRAWSPQLGAAPSSVTIAGSLRSLALEADAETLEHNGDVAFRFDHVAAQLDEARRYRALIDPAELKLGRIVFSSGEEDSPLDDFDARLSPQQTTPMTEAQLLRADAELSGFQARLAGDGGRDTAHQSQLDDFERRLAESMEEQVGVEAASTTKRRS